MFLSHLVKYWCSVVTPLGLYLSLWFAGLCFILQKGFLLGRKCRGTGWASQTHQHPLRSDFTTLPYYGVYCSARVPSPPPNLIWARDTPWELPSLYRWLVTNSLNCRKKQCQWCCWSVALNQGYLRSRETWTYWIVFTTQSHDLHDLSTAFEAWTVMKFRRGKCRTFITTFLCGFAPWSRSADAF